METALSNIKIQVLNELVQQRGRQRPVDLGQTVLQVAVIGVYLNFQRK